MILYTENMIFRHPVGGSSRDMDDFKILKTYIDDPRRVIKVDWSFSGIVESIGNPIHDA